MLNTVAMMDINVDVQYARMIPKENIDTDLAFNITHDAIEPTSVTRVS